jgi:hypothetical protein
MFQARIRTQRSDLLLPTFALRDTNDIPEILNTDKFQEQSNVDDKLGRIEECHQKFYCMPLIVGHFFPIIEIFFKRDFMRKPGISNRLIVKIIRPFIMERESSAGSV